MPTSASNVVLLAAAVLGAHAARVSVHKSLSLEASSLGKARAVKRRAGANGEVICGGDDIWEMLTASSSVKSIQNIKWARIQSIAGDYLAEMTTEKEKLEVELAQLQARIKEKKAQEEPEKTTEDELTTPLEQSLESFGGSKPAADTACGKPSHRPRANRNCYRDSKTLFAEKADQLLDAKKRFDGETFLEICRKMLPPEGEGSYCGPLCQQLKDKAQAISNSRAGETGGVLSDELIETLMAKQMKLKMVTKDIHRCKNAQESLGAFQTQVGDLKGVQNVRMDELQTAEYALDDALYDLEDLNLDLEKEEEALVQADEALTGEGAKVESVKQEIAQTREQESAVRTELTAGLKRLEDLRGELQAVKDATQMALDMKTALSAVMLKMRLFFDESVLEPLRMMGLDEDLKLETYFRETDKKTAAVSALGDAVDKLSDYCENEAKDVFDAVKDSVDLSELCQFGEPSAFKSDSADAVKEKETMFVSVLSEEVIGWLNPYHHNTGMTEALAMQRVTEGETAGFQEIVGVYSKTKFFKYLREWRNGGTIPKLLLSLETLTGELSKAVQEAEKFVDGLEAQLAAVEQKRDKVIEDLQAAESELAKSAEDQAQLAKAVQELKDKTAAFKTNIEHLREQVRIAKANCEKADQALVDALEAVKANWNKGGSLLQELRTEKLQAENKVRLAQKAVATSQRKLLAMQSWASSQWM